MDRSGRTLGQYKEELKTLMEDVWAGIEKLGEKLVRARKDLSAEDYETLRTWLRTWWTDADLRAAEAVGKGELDPRLFPHGTRNSKVMSLSTDEQARLLSGERFKVYNNFGGTDIRTWAEMTPDQRNRLLGDKGGYIHPITKQRQPGAKRQTVTTYDTASYHQGILLLNGGRTRGEIAVGILVQAMPKDELAEFCEQVSEGLRDKAALWSQAGQGGAWHPALPVGKPKLSWPADGASLVMRAGARPESRTSARRRRPGRATATATFHSPAHPAGKPRPRGMDGAAAAISAGTRRGGPTVALRRPAGSRRSGPASTAGT